MNILSIIKKVLNAQKIDTTKFTSTSSEYDFIDRLLFNPEQKQILKNAANKGLPITSLLDLDYTTEILKVLVCGLENDIKLENYVEVKQFDAAQLNEILLGIKNNVEYDIYAWYEYSAEHMKFLRLGLEKGINVAPYADPLLNINLVKVLFERGCEEL